MGSPLLELGTKGNRRLQRLGLSLLLLLLGLPSLALSQSFDSASEDALRIRRCWEKTTLAMLGTSRMPNQIPNYYGQTFPEDFRPDFIQYFFGDAIYSVAFPNRFASFVNAKWQREQSTQGDRNAPYIVAQYVVGNRLPWRQTFLGRYDIDFFEGRNKVIDSPEGLGYFRVKKWLQVYAGNEAQGYKLSTAYRILNNTLGIHLTAAPNNTAVPDSSATGRAAPGCTGCHFEGPYPLDKVARVLTRRVGMGEMMSFAPPSDGPQMLWGHSVKDDEELVSLLVNSEQFTFNTCRLVFEFMYGRTESTCDAPVFDACVAGFEAEGTIQAAIMGMVRHPDYCR